MKKKTPPAGEAPDPWKEKLLESLKQERPSPRRWGLWLGIGLLAVMALLTWWLYPRELPPLPPLVTFDVLIPTGAEAPVRAVFEMPEESQPPPRLQGRRFLFQESRLPLPGQELSMAQLLLEKDGVASATLKVPATMRQVAFEAHCPGKDREPGVKDQAHIFNFPAAAKLLLVSVEGTLSLESIGQWEKANPGEVVAVPEASPALQGTRKQGFEVVYLALESDRLTTYQKMRGWTRFRFGAGPASLPDGPVLGRPDYPGDVDAAYSGVLSKLKTQFAGPHIALTSSPTLARRFQSAGYRTLLVGDGEAIANIERLRGWDELARVLEKK